MSVITEIDTGQPPAHVAAQLNVSRSSVDDALSYDDAHIDELRTLGREMETAFERVSVKPH